jgi:two-component system, OmpR family, sensor histidine kinase KdpD
MSDQRPDPDALLARVKEEEARKTRGKLKIFLGAAAGVGKTYAMLEAAHERRAAGVNVVVGWVDTHGRAETEALLTGLEILPRSTVPYRGTTLEEFDLDAALARHPTLILVDELAHTNAPGMRHSKRWQDVQELLDAGIDVYTAINIQHVESLRDVVAQITSVVVQETVPDHVLEQADEIEVIDLSPDDLLQRLKDGKVYIPAQAREAVQNFFRRGNLIALRELALRRAADRVDSQMRLYMRDHAIPKTWPVTERLMACIGPSPHSAQVIRAAKRFADSLRAEWIVAYVETATHAQLPGAARARVVENLRLAEQLGAETVTLSGSHISHEVLAHARQRNVSKIVVGKPRQPLWKRIAIGSIADSLLRGSDGIDIYVISGEGEVPSSRTAQPRRVPVRNGAGYALACGVVAACTALAWLMFPHFELANIIMTYLLGVVAVAMRTSLGPSILCSVLSVGAFDFFFVPPYFSFAVSDTQYLVTFAVMLFVAVILSNLTRRMRVQAESARLRERRTAALYAMSRELSSARGLHEVITVALKHITEVFRSQAVVMLPDASGQLVRQVGMSEQFDRNTSDLGVSKWAFEHGQMAGLGTGTLPGATALFLPLIASRRLGVLGVRPSDPESLLAPEQLHQLETFANQTALAMERTLLAEESRVAQVRIEKEQLRSSLLSSVSHDLRTPLAAITGTLSGLLEDEGQIDSGTRRELLQAVYEEVERLTRLVNNLLDMMRLESGAVTARKEWHLLEEVVGTALAHLEERLQGRAVDVRLPPDLPLVEMDAVLIEQVLVNLLDNAVKYTPPGAPIEVIARRSDGAIEVSVADRGPGLPPGDGQRVFEKFYRGQPSTTRGVGLGLAICKAIVETHGGAIWAENRPGGGAIFLFTLPATTLPPEVSADA